LSFSISYFQNVSLICHATGVSLTVSPKEKILILDNYDKKVLRNYLKIALSDNRMTHKMYSEVCDWFEDHLEDIVSTEISDATWAAIGDYNCAIGEHSNTVSAQKKFLTAISQLFVTNKETETTSSQLEITLATLTSEMKLDESDI